MIDERRLHAAWYRPLLFCAVACGIACLAIVLGGAAGAIPIDAGVPLQCGLASASLTFTTAQIVVVRRLSTYEVITLCGGAIVLVFALLAVRP